MPCRSELSRRAVGVTLPSIYLHFADETELIFAICERDFDELTASRGVVRVAAPRA